VPVRLHATGRGALRFGALSSATKSEATCELFHSFWASVFLIRVTSCTATSVCVPYPRSATHATLGTPNPGRPSLSQHVAGHLGTECTVLSWHPTPTFLVEEGRGARSTIDAFRLLAACYSWDILFQAPVVCSKVQQGSCGLFTSPTGRCVILFEDRSSGTHSFIAVLTSAPHTFFSSLELFHLWNFFQGARFHESLGNKVWLIPVRRVYFDIMLIRLLTFHNFEKQSAVYAAFCMTICCHVSSVAPLNGFYEAYLEKLPDPTHMSKQSFLGRNF
jgi:hypothetical protein